MDLVSIIERDADARALLLRQVQSFECDASGFASVDDFLQADAVCPSACIIASAPSSDYNLMRGLTASQAPVILITDSGDRDALERAVADGALFVLQPPVLPHVLEYCVSRALAIAARVQAKA